VSIIQRRRFVRWRHGVSRYRETMVHGFHVIFGAYGFWLPNDPRGSWSDFVGSWELWRFGPATKSLERKLTLSLSEQRRLDAARRALKYPAVEFTPRIGE